MLKKHCFNGYKRAVFQTLPKTGGVVLSYFTGGEKMNDSKKKPCSKCPYALGLVHTVTNPCPKCAISRMNGFKSSYQETVQFPKRKNEGMEDIVWQDCRRKMI